MARVSYPSKLFPYTTLFRSGADGIKLMAPGNGRRENGATPLTGDERLLEVSGLKMFYPRSEEHTSELQSPCNLVCGHLLVKKQRRHALLRIRPTHVENSLAQ